MAGMWSQVMAAFRRFGARPSWRWALFMASKTVRWPAPLGISGNVVDASSPEGSNR